MHTAELTGEVVGFKTEECALFHEQQRYRSYALAGGETKLGETMTVEEK